MKYVKGLDAIVRQLGSVKQAIGDGSFRVAAAEWARIEFLPRARALCPVATGFLRDSISFTATGSQVTVFVSAPYAGYVEFGTSVMPARPFIRPAFEAARKRLSFYTRKAINGGYR